MGQVWPRRSLHLSEWLWAGLDLLAPPVCAGCGLTGSAWCRECADRTNTIAGPLCPVCGAPAVSWEACSHCGQYPAVYTAARSFALYRKPFRSILIRMKYFQDQALGGLAAELVLPAVLETGWPVDLVLPVPLGRSRRARRGYNQVDLFGRPLARRLARLYAPAALKRVRETRSQVGLSGEERSQNLAEAFRADRARVAGKAVLLLDDVFTTGSTANACARELFACGARQVFVFTLARALEAPDDPQDHD